MNPAIEAAWIAGTSGVVGIAGFRNTLRATRDTADAAHKERVWDRKADTYQEALTASLWR
jgi:hypothetical protein